MLIKEGDFNRNERWMLAGMLVLLLCALFVNLGIYPLYLEEPRRGLIALEMMFQDNLWVPTQTGDLYYRKPPFYNWLIILSYQIFGGYSEFATRLVSVLSALVTGVVIYRFFKFRLGKRLAVYAALSYVTCVDILFYFSMIDRFILCFSYFFSFCFDLSFWKTRTVLAFVLIRIPPYRYWFLDEGTYFFAIFGNFPVGLFYL